jgi:hypothetical protein
VALSSLGAASGLILCLLWSPMAVVVPRLPDLRSSASVRAFYRAQGDLLQVVIILVALGFFFFLAFLGSVVERLRRDPSSGALTWVVLASAVMFMTSLNIAIGLAATADLLHGVSSPGTVYALHAAAFVLAAPAAGAGTAFFVAIAIASFGTAVFPRWLASVAVIAAVANVGAVGGIVSRTGPLNAGNGAVAGIAVPLFAWVLWILLTSLWLLRQRPASGSDQRAPLDLSI